MSDKRILEIDGIRAIACLLVLTLHCVVGPLPLLEGTLAYEIRFVFLIFLAGGVDLFFVLSGFLIGGILLDNRESRNIFRVFWARRITRIFPVYYLLVALYGLILLAPQLPPWLQVFQITTVPYWSYATFTQNFAMAAVQSGGSDFLGVTWSLAVEEQFYLILPLLAVLLSRRWLMVTAAIAIIATPLIRTYFWSHIGFHWAYILLPCRMDTLMWGVIAAYIIRNEKALQCVQRYRRWGDLIAAAIFLSIIFQALPTLAAWLFPSKTEESYPKLLIITLQNASLAVLLMWGVLRVFTVDRSASRYCAVLRWQPLRVIGLISYSAYMIHQIINNMVHVSIHGNEPVLTGWGDFYIPILVLGITFILAGLSYRFIEEPFRRLGRRINYEPATPSNADRTKGAPPPSSESLWGTRPGT